MVTRRAVFISGAKFFGAGAALFASRNAISGETKGAQTRAPVQPHNWARYNPVVTLNGSTLPWKMDNGVKVFHLIAEPVKREFAPGMVVNCWGYNGQTPGPTIEAVEGDRVRLLVTNRLPEETSIHWHGIFLPNGMDGVAGLNQPHIPVGKTYVYEYTLRQNGTFMYHPHSDETVQMAMGMMGMFVIHPKDANLRRVERDFCIMLHNWDIDPGTATPKFATMTDFNMWTMNSRVFPGIDSMVVRKNDRVRIRMGNLSMHDHPMHIHGHAFMVTGTDGGWIAEAAQWPASTVPVPVGSTRVVEFVAEAAGDWAFHCHKTHHAMNAMGHAIANMQGVDQTGLDEKIRSLVPGYMAMGETGMGEHEKHAAMGHMQLPENTLPMMTGIGPFGPMGMGGMFTVVKVRDNLAAGDYRDPGWYQHPEGTVAYELT